MTKKIIRNSSLLIIAVSVVFMSIIVVNGAGTGTVKTVPVKKGQAAVTISATVDKPKITIGDKITYSVTITHHKKIKVTLPEIADTLQQFEVKDYEILKPGRKWGKVINEFRYVITTFFTGEYKIGSFMVKWTDGEGKQKELKSGEITIFVESVKASESDKDDIRDIKAPVTMKRSRLFYILLIGIPVLLLLGYGVFVFTRKAKEGGFFGKGEPEKPADELAYERLDKLKTMGLIEKGDVKQHYIILSEIIRRYMEARYGVTVLDMTTYELFQQLRTIGADKKHTGVIKVFLDECDMVKFAKYKPEQKIVDEDFENARKIVDITKTGLAKEDTTDEEEERNQAKS